MARIRTNTYLSGAVSGVRRTSIFASWNNYSYAGRTCTESVIDETHSRIHNGACWSGGGPFDLNRSTDSWAGIQPVKWYNAGGALLGEGTVRILNPSGTNPPTLSPYSHPSESSLFADASTAIARIEPTRPAFDLSVFLGELRAEGLPKLPGASVREKTRLARASGSEYLNIEFGWSPLVRGVRDFAKVVDQSDKIVNSYKEHANKVTQRSYEWPVEEASQVYNCNHVMEYPAGFFTGGGHSEKISRKKWLEAEFVYYLPTGNTAGEKISRYGSYARKLLGLDLSPEVLWNLSPWSWAADWFGNVGDVMHNVSAFATDGLVMRHGYIMCHTRKEIVDYGSFAGNFQVRTQVNERKTRHVASPYGFGVSDSSLTTRQIAIVAALGLSRT